MTIMNEKTRALAEKIASDQEMLKQKVSVFNAFRGVAFTLVITKMVLQDNPEAYLDGVMSVYQKLRSIHKLTASPYMVMAALTIYENGGSEKADWNIAKQVV